jgi:anti-sigma factor RsiW
VANIIQMTQCVDIEASLSAYVDGEAAAPERAAVERHVRLCPTCHQRLASERAVREAFVRNRAGLRATAAPAELKVRLQSLAAQTRPARARGWAWVGRMAAAAVLVLTAGGWILGVVTRDSTVVLAAQLTADHAKCFLTAHDRGLVDPDRAGELLRRRYGFDVRVPPSSASLGLRLVGARRCLSGVGTNAHLLYTWGGESVSLYMLPADHHAPANVTVLGHDACVWSGHNGSYVLVAHQSGRDLAPLVDYMQHATE